MADYVKDTIETIEHEIVVLLRRADFKRTLDGRQKSLDRSGYLILQRLYEDGPTTTKELSKLFQLNISTVSRQIAALESKGLIAREIDEKDARVSFLSITEDGRRAFLHSKKERYESYTEILEGWTDEERDIFATLLTRLNRKIEKRRKLQS
ncbi:MarR family winged helix-turn-helix transcriptional regulator [Heyndrickxia ginsengihumi]|uniref:MarR family transcriptional regulator n=1 Tax=Heyndrickxia ginsengihumi TaxID=363870 RepID=A0A0A6VBV7_9BACI|nr:MarR family transcriptional regulator [Heyndrickxia ginsengihumi]KHD85061.1 hypothetical protein NG54_11555 [Heyndrickxia ginsengihumi]MBE6184455.1 MarR family transcriptional regulator [Bacillus sp. (in: firmicutes)]NEY21038.1 MarR family transcriptional regulator [Heyndrickxia ginsengihumi]